LAWEVVAVAVPVSLLLGLAMHAWISEPIRLMTWKRSSIWRLGTAVAMCGAVVGVTGFAPVHGSSEGPRVLTLGDSLANDFASALSSQDAGVQFNVVDGGIGGCGIFGPEATATPNEKQLPVPGSCLPWQSRYRDQIVSAKPEVVVIDLAWDATSQLLDGEWTDLTQRESADRYRRQLADLASIVTAANAKAIIADSRVDTPVTTEAAAVAHNAILAEFVADHPNFTLLGLNDEFCPEGTCSSRTPSGDPMYLDKVHFSGPGLKILAPWLAQAVTGALTTSRDG
jgi:hypothetical protein